MSSTRCGVLAKEQKRMESQQNVPEQSPMLITVPQVWDRLTLEHQRRLLQALVLICEELLRLPQRAPTREAPHE
jgi:hypothetical protein